MPNSIIAENHPVTGGYGVGTEQFFLHGDGGLIAGAGGAGRGRRAWGGGKVTGGEYSF